MFTPQNQKKLVNVCVIALKKYGRRYELAVYPNKLYEYRNGITTCINEIVQSSTVYKNVSKGEIAAQDDLSMFGKSHDEIVKEILDNGHEQKNEATRMYEQERTEREILEIVGRKVTKDGKHVNMNVLRDAMSKVHNVHIGDSKKQSQEVVAKLERIGYERVGMRIAVDLNNSSIRRFVDQNGEVNDAYVILRSNYFPAFKRICDSESVKYIVVRNEDPDDEEIC
ncbi:putative subunit of exosome [Ordospora colligata]|uniref:Putative subunit of exosome n=1 Tax=Ordospora colligata OC4 TaxID=1354746 RepID=A0A0B2UJT7_9MICR|nr:putative subunit of exosome [Ordospora colligata OC4]KHN69230.1 putative subunit of exosome [Ordospora colligata OC4]TBU14508.1 putative subunit of exosome [Ordospora colligata]TBU14685.1 putative subunit of exosome [Ordospora colligata]TBU18070.1 putative subunit of exosome [Ordospora colligata]